VCVCVSNEHPCLFLTPLIHSTILLLHSTLTLFTSLPIFLIHPFSSLPLSLSPSHPLHSLTLTHSLTPTHYFTSLPLRFLLLTQAFLWWITPQRLVYYFLLRIVRRCFVPFMRLALVIIIKNTVIGEYVYVCECVSV
jgi:hypothetical protein